VQDEIARVGLVDTFDDDTKGDLQGQCRSETQGSAYCTDLEPMGSLTGFAERRMEIRLDELYLWPRCSVPYQVPPYTMCYMVFEYRRQRRSTIILSCEVPPPSSGP